MDVHLGSLLVFRHLAQSGSFTETGRRCGISQPAVSLMIGRLESGLELVLFERAASGVRLTPDGERFLVSANEVCESYLAFIDGMGLLGRRSNHEVSVGFDGSSFGMLLRRDIPKLKLPPDVKITCGESPWNWVSALESSKLDLVVAGRFLRSGFSAGIQEAVIRKERGITVAWNPDFYQFDAANFSFLDILRTSVLMPDAGTVTGFESCLSIWCDHAYGMQPANAITFSSEPEAAIAAAAGLGVLLGPGDLMSRLGIASNGLIHVRTFEFLLPEAYTFGVYCRGDETSKEVLSVAAQLVAHGRRRLAGNAKTDFE